MNSSLFQLNLSDFQKGLVVALASGFLLPVAAAIQTPDFNILTVNWNAIFQLALNGAIVGFTSYIGKNFFSTADGKVFGRIG